MSWNPGNDLCVFAVKKFLEVLEQKLVALCVDAGLYIWHIPTPDIFFMCVIFMLEPLDVEVTDLAR